MLSETKIPIDNLYTQILSGCIEEFTTVCRTSFEYTSISEIRILVNTCYYNESLHDLVYYDLEVDGVEFEDKLYVFKSSLLREIEKFYTNKISAEKTIAINKSLDRHVLTKLFVQLQQLWATKYVVKDPMSADKKSFILTTLKNMGYVYEFKPDTDFTSFLSVENLIGF
jgi:hypothetical protein